MAAASTSMAHRRRSSSMRRRRRGRKLAKEEFVQHNVIIITTTTTEDWLRFSTRRWMHDGCMMLARKNGWKHYEVSGMLQGRDRRIITIIREIGIQQIDGVIIRPGHHGWRVDSVRYSSLSIDDGMWMALWSWWWKWWRFMVFVLRYTCTHLSIHLHVDIYEYVFALYNELTYICSVVVDLAYDIYPSVGRHSSFIRSTENQPTALRNEL